MYIGPNILGLVQSGKVYFGDRATVLAHPDVARAVERIPLIKTMIVPGSTLGADLQNLKKPGTAMYTNYRRILANT